MRPQFQHASSTTLLWARKRREKLSETKRRVALHAGFPQLPASLIHCAKHTVILVNVYSNVIHENSSFLFSSTLCTEGLLSFYLTPFPLPSSLSVKTGQAHSDPFSPF